MSRKSRIIIVGSGIVGASTAYHLAQLGWKDMLILDQGPLFDQIGDLDLKLAYLSSLVELSDKQYLLQQYHFQR